MKEPIAEYYNTYIVYSPPYIPQQILELIIERLQAIRVEQQSTMTTGSAGGTGSSRARITIPPHASPPGHKAASAAALEGDLLLVHSHLHLGGGEAEPGIRNGR